MFLNVIFSICCYLSFFFWVQCMSMRIQCWIVDWLNTFSSHHDNLFAIQQLIFLLTFTFFYKTLLKLHIKCKLQKIILKEPMILHNLTFSLHVKPSLNCITLLFLDNILVNSLFAFNCILKITNS